MSQKRSLGQFFTKNQAWLKNHIRKFIEEAEVTNILDPFAGNGDILDIFPEYNRIGMDIDSKLGWQMNDSLLSIPYFKDTIIVTNPPYITNYSAKRKGIYDSVKMYFEGTKYEDLYQRALDKCLEKNDFIVAIIPETYVNSARLSERLYSLTIIEDDLFDDTDCPTCIACFRKEKSSEILVYKNDDYIGKMHELQKLRPGYDHSVEIIFNTKKGRIGLRAVDGVNIDKRIAFLKREELNYSEDKIKVSSRLITFIEIPSLSQNDINQIIYRANVILEDMRKESHDIVLSAFKGNAKNGTRRRRLDYRTARAILEQAYKNLFSSQTQLFSYE